MDISTRSPTVYDSTAYVADLFSRAATASNKAAKRLTEQLPEAGRTGQPKDNWDRMDFTTRQDKAAPTASPSAEQTTAASAAQADTAAGRVEGDKTEAAKGEAPVSAEAAPSSDASPAAQEPSGLTSYRDMTLSAPKSARESLQEWAQENKGRSEPLREGVNRLRETLYEATKRYLEEFTKPTDASSPFYTKPWYGLESGSAAPT